MSAFRVGQRVVCISNTILPNTDRGAEAIGLSDLEVGRIYTIRDIATRTDGKSGVRLVEFGATPYGYLAERFRPLIDQADDVALFTHHFDREGAEA